MNLLLAPKIGILIEGLENKIVTDWLKRIDDLFENNKIASLKYERQATFSINNYSHV